MGGRYLHCATSVIAGQYATSVVNRCWSGFPCKWQYINVETFNLLSLVQVAVQLVVRADIQIPSLGFTDAVQPDT